MGQSGALSLQGWSQQHGIDGVVMRDGDVREQTPIQSGTSKRGLLGNFGAHHHLLWAGGRGIEAERNREEGGTVKWGSHTSPHCGFIILECDLIQL